MFHPFKGGLPRILILAIAGLLAGLILLSPAVQAAPSIIPNLILTSTPMGDGSIVHIVAEGENLASIAEAYGVSMADIRSMNAMAPTSNLIFPGQKLIIRLPLPATETPTVTATLPRPTRTPTAIIPTRTPRPTRTPTPVIDPSATPNPQAEALTGFFKSNQRVLLIAMIAICGIGLAWTLWKGFRPGSPD